MGSARVAHRRLVAPTVEPRRACRSDECSASGRGVGRLAQVAKAVAETNPAAIESVEMLEADHGKLLTFALVSGRKL